MQSPNPDLDRLPDTDLERTVDRLVRQERTGLLELLCALATVEGRRLHLELGHGSMFAYLTDGLGYTESAASRRIKAARCLRRFPEMVGMFARGEICLSTIALFAPLLDDESLDPASILSEVAGKNQRQVREVVARHHPQPPTPDRTTPVRTELLENGGEITIYRFEFEGDEDLAFGLCQVEEILSTKHPEGVTREQLLKELVNDYVKKHEPSMHPADPTVGDPRSRHIPRALRSAVYRRDGGCCRYIGRKGRCRSRWNLQVDHIIPVARGGETEMKNLRLLCAAHNRLVAIQLLGREAIARHARKLIDALGGGNDVTAAAGVRVRGTIA